MLKAPFVCVAGILVFTASSADATCSGSLTTLANATTADAMPVNGNFTTVYNCANIAAPINNPSFTGTVGIGTATPNASLDVVSGTIIETTGTGSNTRTLTLLNNGQSQLNYGAYSGSWRPSLQIQNNDNSNFVHILPADASNSTPAVIRAAASGLNVDVGGTVSTAGTHAIQIDTSANTTLGGNFYVNGSAGGITAWAGPSDIRLKKNIVPVTNAMSILEQLRGVRFQWRAPQERKIGKDLNLPVNEPEIGFIAQEVKSVLPEAVSVAPDGDRLMSLKETKIIPVLVEAMKQLAVTNKTQAAQLDKQSSQIAQLLMQMTALKRTVSIRAPANDTHLRRTAFAASSHRWNEK